MDIIQAERLYTPCYVIDKKKFIKNVDEIDSSFRNEWGDNIILGYSIKTNHLKELLVLAEQYGMYAEAVSEDEFVLAKRVGYASNKIIYNGPQKSEKSIIFALENGSIVNLDNFDEIRLLEKNIARLDQNKINVGLRVNYDLEAMRPNETTAGKEVSRFGFCVDNGDFEKAFHRLCGLGIPVRGLHMHYSSRTRSCGVFQELSAKACQLAIQHNLESIIRYIDIGGGFFGGQIVDKMPTMQDYAQVISKELKKVFDPEKVTLILEPGASILAAAADYITKVINTRTIRDTVVVTVDGSNLHINPFLAEREPRYKLSSCCKEMVPLQIVCGSTCMENDRILRLNNKPRIIKGDYLQCFYAGAYTMGFNNCFINLPPYIYLKQDEDYELCRGKDDFLMLNI